MTDDPGQRAELNVNIQTGVSEDDIERRSAEFERRVREAGGRDGVINALVQDAIKSRKMVRWLAVSLAIDVVLSIVLGIVGVVAFRNAQAVENENVASCIQTNKNSTVINGFLDLLIDFSKRSDTLTAKEKENRIDGYNKLKILIPNCKQRVSSVLPP